MKNKISNKIYLSLLGALLAAAIIFSIGFSKNDVVAKVGNESISEDELYTMLVEQYGTDALESLISKKVIELEADKEKVKVTEKEKETEMQVLVDSSGGEEAFNLALEQNGVTLKSMEKQIEEYLITKKLLEPRIKITEEEMKTYFDKNKDTFSQQGEAVYEEYKEEIKESLFQEKIQTEYTAWLEEKKEDYKIENLLNK